MQQLQQEQLESALSGAQEQSQQAQEQINNLIESMKPLIELMVMVSILAMAAFILLHLLGMLHKRRVEKAILRIDANLEKLVTAQVPVTEDAESKTQSEQK